MVASQLEGLDDLLDGIELLALETLGQVAHGNEASRAVVDVRVADRVIDVLQCHREIFFPKRQLERSAKLRRTRNGGRRPKA